MKSKVFSLLQNHVPANTFQYCFTLWEQTPFELKIARSRQTLAGDFTCRKHSAPRITLNHDLNPFLFLVTYIHEVAHLRVFLHYGDTVGPHGPEWKRVFQNIMRPLLQESVFPPKILHELLRHMKAPKASSFSDSKLTKALREYNLNGEELLTLISLPEGSIFKFHTKVFKRGKLKRTRVLCEELKTRKQYLVPADVPVTEVHLSLLDKVF